MGERDSGPLKFPILDRVRILRHTSGLSLQAVAKRAGAGISPAYIHQLERGRVRAPSPHKLKQLAPALDTEYLLLMAWAGYIYEPPVSPEDVDPVTKMAEIIGVEKLTVDEAIMCIDGAKEYKKCIEAGIGHEELVAVVGVAFQAQRGETVDWRTIGL